MALGDDHGGERFQRKVGAMFLLALGGAIVAVLLLAGRTIGRGRHFQVEFSSTGALKVEARLRVAGREAGEVRDLRAERGRDGTRHVVADCFVAADWAGALRRNSDYFIATPSILGEAYLEVGPPLRGAEPGPAIAEGERVRGSDPPELDRLIPRLYASTTTILLLLRAQKPEMDELVSAAQSMLSTLSGLPADPGQLARIRDQAVLLADQVGDLVGALDEAQAVPRLRKMARDLGETADTLGPELAIVVQRADAAMARIDGLSDLWSPARQARARRGIEALKRAAEIGDAIAADVKQLAARVERGEGSLGAFLADQELFDDLHETHRILKSQPWTLFLKAPKGWKTLAR